MPNQLTERTTPYLKSQRQPAGIGLFAQDKWTIRNVTLNAGVTTTDEGAEVAVAFSRAEVIPQLVGKTPSVELLIYVLDEHGVAGFKSKRLSFTGAARVTTGFVTLREPFELPKGKYTAKILLRIAGTTMPATAWDIATIHSGRRRRRGT